MKPRSLKSQATWLLQPHLPLSHMVWPFKGMILLFKDMFGVFKNIFRSLGTFKNMFWLFNHRMRVARRQSARAPAARPTPILASRFLDTAEGQFSARPPAAGIQRLETRAAWTAGVANQSLPLD